MKVTFKEEQKNTNMTGCDGFHEEQSQTKQSQYGDSMVAKSISINGDI